MRWALQSGNSWPGASPQPIWSHPLGEIKKRRLPLRLIEAVQRLRSLSPTRRCSARAAEEAIGLDASSLPSWRLAIARAASARGRLHTYHHARPFSVSSHWALFWLTLALCCFWFSFSYLFFAPFLFHGVITAGCSKIRIRAKAVESASLA